MEYMYAEIIIKCSGCEQYLSQAQWSHNPWNCPKCERDNFIDPVKNRCIGCQYWVSIVLCPLCRAPVDLPYGRFQNEPIQASSSTLDSDREFDLDETDDDYSDDDYWDDDDED
jgi:phage FluMu protein Com